MNEFTLPEATVLNTTGDSEVVVNRGSRDGIVSGLEMIVVRGREQVGKCYTLDLAEMVIGRAADAQIRIEDDGVSRYHAKLTVTTTGVVLEDLKSKNGTLVNGNPIKKHILQNNDVIEIGKYTLKFFGEAAAAGPTF